MGKAVSKGLKFRAEELFTQLSDRFGTNFEKNKLSVSTMELGLSKSSRNVLAGYITRLAKQAEAAKLK